MRAGLHAAAIAGSFALLACAGAPEGAPPARNETVSLRLLSFNDFHGHLLPGARGLGGAARLSGLIDELRDDDTLVVSPGDLVGASPLISAHFRDEPTIELMNHIGLDLFAVGNHEFDEGVEALLRLRDGDPSTGYAGSRFPFLAANVFGPDGELLFEPYRVVDHRGVPVAFIGLTLEGTPEIVAPDLGGLRFEDEVETVSRIVAELRAQGVEAIVVMLHEGGFQKGGPNECVGLKGPIREIVEALPDAVDVVLSGHTHRSYLCEIDGKLLTAGGSNGRMLTRVDLDLSLESKDVVGWTAANLDVDASAPEDSRVAAFVDGYAEQVKEVARRVIGSTREPLSKDPLFTGESPLGSFIADAQLAATNADVALTNLGGIRGSLGLGRPEVTFGDLFRVQPFDNHMVVIEISGRELIAVLEAQWTNAGEWGLYQVSRSLEYCWSDPSAEGRRIVPGSVRVDGRPLREDARYTLALNSYLANKAPFAEARRVAIRGSDVEALEAFVRLESPITPPRPGRICRAPGPETAQAPPPRRDTW